MAKKTKIDNLPQYVRRLRTRLHMDYATFGLLFGASRNAVYAWEQGLRQPSKACLIIMEQLEDDALRKWHFKRLPVHS